MPYQDYKIISFMGKGGYGEVYKVQHTSTGKLYAMKTATKRSNLQNEAKVVTELKDACFKSTLRNLLSSNCDYSTLEVIEQGAINSKLDYMITSLHGQNTEIIKSMEESDRIHIVLSLGKQIIRSLKVLHNLGYVHGDIKPHNILFEDNDFGLQTCEASDSSYKFVLIDFGISQRYVDEEGEVLPKTRLKSFRGNLEFAAEECLQKFNPMPRHDLISLMYTMLYLISDKESLWKSDEYDFWDISDSMNDSIEGKIRKMILRKQRATVQFLCRDFPALENFCKQVMKTKDYINYEELTNSLNKCQVFLTNEINKNNEKLKLSTCRCYTRLQLNEDSSEDSKVEEDIEQTKDSRDSLIKAFEAESKKLHIINSPSSKRNNFKNALKPIINGILETSESIYYTAKCESQCEQSYDKSCDFGSEMVSIIQKANVPYMSKIMQASKRL